MNWKKSKHTKPQRKEAAAEPAAVHETVDKRVRRKQWTRVFTALACVVVFATTYTLILPAITAEKEDMTGTEITAEESVIQSEVKDPEPGSLVEIAGEESHIGIIVDTGVSEKGEPVVFVLENTEESGLQVTEQPMDDSVVSVLTPEEAVQVEGLEEEVLYLVQAAEEEGILEPKEREALEGDVQESLEELGVVEDSSAAPQNDNSDVIQSEDDVIQSDDDVILSEAKDLEEDSSAQVPQDDNEVLVPQDDNADVAQEEDVILSDDDVILNDDDDILSEAKDLEEDSSAMPQNDIEVPTIAAEAVTDGSNDIIASVLQGTILQQTVNGVTVTARWDEGILPEGTEMKVEPVEAEEYKDLVDEALGAAKAETQSLDITFLNNGKEIEPNGDVQITFRADFIDKEASPEVVHIKSDGTAEVMDTNVVNDEIKLTANSFSVYVIRYTVDFHWEAAGQVYDYSFAGGSYIDMQTLVEALGIGEGDASAFVAEIESMEFSDPSLVWVGKANEDTTVGALKEANGLECEYSAELTEEEIAEINAQTVAAGTWALISLKPFDTEEYLEVTMKNGDEWILRVTDFHEIADSSSDSIDVNKSYIIAYRSNDGKYHVLKTDGTCEVLDSDANLDKLDSTYRWMFNFVFEEKDRPDSITWVYYMVRPISKKGSTIALNEANDPDGLIQETNNNVAIVPQYNGEDFTGFKFIGYNDVQLHYENNEFSGQINGGSLIHIYEMETLPKYDYTVRSADETMGSVSVSDGTLVTVDNGDGTQSHYYTTESTESASTTGKYNAGRITATPSNHQNSELQWWEEGYGQNKWVFDYWDLNGTRLEGVGATITPAATSHVEIPYNGSGLTAHFKVNPNYVFPDNEKQGSSFEDMQPWLDEMMDKELPLDENGCKKTAEVYDYENRIYRVDLTSQASLTTFDGMIDLGFILDVSNSMKFPSELQPIQGLNNVDIRAVNGGFWENNVYHSQNYQLTRGNVYYLISDEHMTSTVYRIEFVGNSWKYKDASKNNWEGDIGTNTYFKGLNPGNNDHDNNYHYQMYYDADEGNTRFDYLNSSITNTTDALVNILDKLTVASANNPSVRVAYNTFNKYLNYDGSNNDDHDTPFGQSQDFAPVSKINANFNYAAGGGTRPDRGLWDAANNWHWQAQDGKRYAILITDGAPQGSRNDLDSANYDTEQIIEEKVKPAAQVLKNMGIELITIGLSMDNVDGGRILLYDLADDINGKHMFFSAETGADLESILLQIVQTIMQEAIVIGQVTDTVGDAFYPVDKATGRPLMANDKIDLLGNKLPDNYSGSDPYGVIQPDGKTIVWRNQEFTHEGWHGTVYVKAKEDLLGGNAVQTNFEDARIDAEGYRMPGSNTITQFDTTQTEKLKTLTINDLESPRVNVNELSFNGNNTKWTVYLGTQVDPKEQLKQLWDSILVEEVVKKGKASDSNHDGLPDMGVFSNDNNWYPLIESIEDNREEGVSGDKETFKMNDLLNVLAQGKNYDWWDYQNEEPNWDAFLTNALSEDGIVIDYDAYSLNGNDNSNITIKLTKDILPDEESDIINQSPHETTVVNGTETDQNEQSIDVPVEKYNLTVLYSPDYDVVPIGQGGHGHLPFHTGTYGTMYQGHAAGTETSTNTHVINVFAKRLKIEKVDQAQNLITGSNATFGLYRKATETEMNDTTVAKVSLEGVQQNPCVLVQTLETANGTVTTDALPLLDNNESYYLKEIQAPDGYNLLSDVMKVSIDMTGHNTWTKKSDGSTSQTKPDPYALSDWQQKATIKVTDLEGNASTYVVLPTTITYDSVNDTTDASVTYKIINISGYELPSTGGPGEEGLMLAGGMLVIGAGVLLIRRFTARIR